eukprot:SM000299S10842  [mRNA]  locus=s299:97141:102711:+ [translate_table: standard]
MPPRCISFQQALAVASPAHAALARAQAHQAPPPAAGGTMGGAGPLRRVTPTPNSRPDYLALRADDVQVHLAGCTCSCQQKEVVCTAGMLAAPTVSSSSASMWTYEYKGRVAWLPYLLALGLCLFCSCGGSVRATGPPLLIQMVHLSDEVRVPERPLAHITAGLTQCIAREEGYQGGMKALASMQQSASLCIHSLRTQPVNLGSVLSLFDLTNGTCVKPAATAATNGYLLVNANGGLNQMRAGICDMVAIARIMNVTLILPQLDSTSYWADESGFEDIFDANHFIDHLEHDVKILKKLPTQFSRTKPLSINPVSWSKASYYLENIMPLFEHEKVIEFKLSDSRLANNGLPPHMQRLRCRTNFEALRFQPTIESLGEVVVRRLRSQGPYVALHLRYEKDILAFSGCSQGLTTDDIEELRQVRYSVKHWKEKVIDAEKRRASGKCPLTPHEAGVFLKALGIPPKMTIYVAAGDLYGGEKKMAEFKSFFPNVVTKETIATEMELLALQGCQNRYAALDYMVAIASNVFVPTYDGNMARMVQGHRRFYGHKRTISPDRVALVPLFDSLANGTLDAADMEELVQTLHSNEELPRLRLSSKQGGHPRHEESFYANPYPGCMCKIEGSKDMHLSGCVRQGRRRRSSGSSGRGSCGGRSAGRGCGTCCAAYRRTPCPWSARRRAGGGGAG